MPRTLSPILDPGLTRLINVVSMNTAEKSAMPLRCGAGHLPVTSRSYSGALKPLRNLVCAVRR